MVFLFMCELGVNVVYRNLFKSLCVWYMCVIVVIFGCCVWGIVNCFMEEIDILFVIFIFVYFVVYDVGKQLYVMVIVREVYEFGVYWVGQGVVFIWDGYMVGELVYLLVQEWQVQG